MSTSPPPNTTATPPSQQPARSTPPAPPPKPPSHAAAANATPDGHAPPPPPPRTSSLSARSQRSSLYAAPSSAGGGTGYAAEVPAGMAVGRDVTASPAQLQEQQQQQQQQQQQGEEYYYAQQPPPPLPPSQQQQMQMQQQMQGQYAAPAAQQHGVRLPEHGWLPSILADKSKPDLHHALSTPALLHALQHSRGTAHGALSASHAALAAQLARNTALAQHLSGALEPQLRAQRERAAQRLLAARGLERAWRNRQAELERKLEPWGPRVLYQRLGQAVAEHEAVCRSLEDSFVDSGGAQAARGSEAGDGGEKASEREVADWVRRVREGRRLVALRRERRARWDEGRVGGWR